MKRLFLFNPDNEMAIANGNYYYMPPANIALMAKELSFLPAYFASAGDYVLMEEHPGSDFLENRRAIFGLIPSIVGCEEARTLDISALEPWGWSPRVQNMLGGIGPLKNKDCGIGWRPGLKEFYSRKFARLCLQELSRSLPFLEERILPRICDSIEAVKAIVCGGEYVVKSPWSSSGKGLWTVKGEVTPKDEEWLRGILRQQGYVMVENKLDKAYDFALEFYSHGEGELQLTGFSGFTTGQKGQYESNYLGKQDKIVERITGYIGKDIFEQIKTEIIQVLTCRLTAVYKGYLGVDMMIYKDGKGTWGVQPCVEINLRYNMGILSQFLSERYLATGTEGYFKINYFPKPGEALLYHSRMQSDFPLNHVGGLINSGYVNLTPITSDTRFLAEINIHRVLE